MPIGAIDRIRGQEASRPSKTETAGSVARTDAPLFSIAANNTETAGSVACGGSAGGSSGGGGLNVMA